MGTIDEAIHQHSKDCAEELPKKFVPWTWVVGLFTGNVVIIASAMWFLASNVSSANSKSTQALEKSINIEQKFDRYSESIEIIRKYIENQQKK
jgi:hypothetical protein